MIWLLPIAAVVGLAGYFGYKAVSENLSSETAVTLDGSLPQTDTVAVLDAIQTQTDPAALMTLAQKYATYPWASYELSLRAWELSGKQGPQPAPPTVSPSPAPGSAPAPAPSSQQQWQIPQAPNAPQPAGAVGDIRTLAEEAVAAVLGATGQQAPAPAAPPSFDMSSIYVGNAASVGAGPGWTAVDPSTATALEWTPSAEIPADTATEVQRLTSARLDGTLLEQAPDGTVWMFQGAAGIASMPAVVIALMGKGQLSVAPTPPPSDSPPVEPPAPLPPEPLPPGGAVPPPVTSTSGAAPAPSGGRPLGGSFVLIRPGDKVWPRKLAEIGTGVHRGASGSLDHLADINPHLAKGGVIRELQSGDEINVPSSWAPALKKKGFQVGQDMAGSMSLSGTGFGTSVDTDQE